MNVQMVYMTVAGIEEAQAIARELVARRLAACVNIIENMKAVYMWEGRLQEGCEVVMIAKTVGWRVPQLIEAVRSMHSYAVPCIVTLPITGGHRPFLEWVTAETGPVTPGAVPPQRG